MLIGGGSIAVGPDGEGRCSRRPSRWVSSPSSRGSSRRAARPTGATCPSAQACTRTRGRTWRAATASRARGFRTFFVSANVPSAISSSPGRRASRSCRHPRRCLGCRGRPRSTRTLALVGAAFPPVLARLDAGLLSGARHARDFLPEPVDEKCFVEGDGVGEDLEGTERVGCAADRAIVPVSRGRAEREGVRQLVVGAGVGGAAAGSADPEGRTWTEGCGVGVVSPTRGRSGSGSRRSVPQPARRRSADRGGHRGERTKKKKRGGGGLRLKRPRSVGLRGSARQTLTPGRRGRSLQALDGIAGHRSVCHSLRRRMGRAGYGRAPPPVVGTPTAMSIRATGPSWTEVGVEPTRGCPQRRSRPSRLLNPHSGAKQRSLYGADARAPARDVPPHRATPRRGGPRQRAPATGDRAAFTQLVEHYQSACYGLAWRLLGDPDQAADAAQDAFVHAYDAIHRLPRRPFPLVAAAHHRQCKLRHPAALPAPADDRPARSRRGRGRARRRRRARPGG